MKKYKLTSEHRAQLPAWRDKWIANAMSTEPMTEDDREACRDAVLRMYAAAKLPPPKHIVFVPSPFVLRFAGGFAAGIWHLAGAQKSRSVDVTAATRDATYAATYAATRAATDAATRDATDDAAYAATDAATRAATDAATRDAAYAATYAATRDATDDATDAATRDATYDATYDATRAATRAATRDATYDATRAATRAATYDAAYDATDVATYDAARAATRAATRDATDVAAYDATDDESRYYVFRGLHRMGELANLLGVGQIGLDCAKNAWRMWSGGNQWSGWTASISFFRHIAQLDIDYTAWDAWEVLTRRSGPRIMHPDFCMISDRPARLMVDDQNRPHCDDGPFCSWRDGSMIYAVRGQYVPAWIIEHPDRIAVAEIRAETNIEIRRVMIEKMGTGRYLTESGATLVDADERTSEGGGPRALLRDSDGSQWLCGTDGSTSRVYYMSVPNDVMTCRDAHCAIAGIDEDLVEQEG